MVPTKVSASPKRMLTRKPYSSRAVMSRPAESVPSQCPLIGGARVVVERVGPELVQREQREVAVLRELLRDERVVPIGGRREITADARFGRIADDRKEPFTPVARDQRPVVGEQLREHPHDQHGGEDHQRDMAETVALEPRPGAARGGKRGRALPPGGGRLAVAHGQIDRRSAHRAPRAAASFGALTAAGFAPGPP
jgi:hypothetical protein